MVTSKSTIGCYHGYHKIYVFSISAPMTEVVVIKDVPTTLVVIHASVEMATH